MEMAAVKIAIIGGTGLDNPEFLEDRSEKFVETPFGKPSDALILGTINGVPCVLLARHGRKHSIMPGNVNYRANIWALKEENCTHVLVTTACGSLQGNMKPGDIVLIDQFIDRTTKRHQTFYDGSETAPPGVCHIPMHTPFCAKSREIIAGILKELGYSFHPSGTIVTIEGPRFSSRAESKLFHSWGADVINMTTVPEVVLAKEAGLCYAAMALVTDYDSWRDEYDSEHVSVEMALAVMKKNASLASKTIVKAISAIASSDWTGMFKENENISKMSVML